MRIAPALLALVLTTTTTGCYHAVPVARANGFAPGGETSPLEQLSVELPVANDEAVQLVRRALFESGMMVAQHDRRGRWVLAEAGAVDDPIVRAVRQVFLVASYQPASTATTVVSIGAMERTLQTMGVSRGTGTPQVLTSVRRLSEQTGRDSGAWDRVRQIADYLVDHGGHSIEASALRRPTP